MGNATPAALVLQSRRIGMVHDLADLSRRLPGLDEPGRRTAAAAIKAGGWLLDSPDATARDWAETEYQVRCALRETAPAAA